MNDHILGYLTMNNLFKCRKVSKIIKKFSDSFLGFNVN
jgi:hypothetical protein